jgi:beta-phosphoglucomutase
MRPMLKAIIFDFNGVILDDEPLHFAAMREAVAAFGIDLTREAYWDRYLPMDDAGCLEAICRDNDVRLSDKQRKNALAHKAAAYDQLLQNRFPLFPGAARFIKSAFQRYPLAMASGARREEIEATLNTAGLDSLFTVIVAAEDFTRGKPHPESYLLALERLNAKIRQSPPILPGECLVIEDSVAGIKGAQAAGMVCLAISNSYPGPMLSAANRIAASLEEVQVDSLRALFGEPV